MNILFYIAPLFFIVAFLYSSVGHGGASGYLAIMTLFGFLPDEIKPTALLLNILVSSISFIQYYRKGYFDFKLFWPFAISSIPAAYLGALISVDTHYYKIILGVLLLFPVLRLFGMIGKEQTEKKPLNLFYAVLIGAAIGFFSGIIGIGGGIILSPIILLLGWGKIKETATVSALFIVVNSVSGLIGFGFDKLIQLHSNFYLFVLVSIVGGLIGASWGSNIKQESIIKKVLAVVLLFASLKLIFI